MKSGIIYTRVSTAEQVQGTSLDSQLLACQGMATLRGITVVAHEEDAGISGAQSDRPGLSRALATIEQGGADCLIVYRLDRVGRTVRGIIDVAEKLDNRGVPILTCDGMEFGATLTGRFIMHQFAAIAELERGMIRERCGRGRAARASAGVQPSSRWSPFGYHIPTRPEVMAGLYSQEEVGCYLIQPHEAAVVVLLYQRIVEGASLRSLCAELTERGIASPSGGQWYPGSLGRMLRQRLYRGEASWSGIPIACPAIVPVDLWEQAQERLTQSKMMGGPRLRRYLLSGLVRCPECGCRMAGSKSDGQRYYRCQREKKGGCQSRPRVKEDALIEALACVLTPELPGLAQAAMNAHAQRALREAQPSEQERAESESELRRLEQARLDAIRLQVSAPSSARAAYAQVIEELSQKEATLRTRLEKLTRTKGNDTQEVVGLLTRLPSLLHDLLYREDIPASERGRVIETLFPRIVVEPERVRLECPVGASVLCVLVRRTDTTAPQATGRRKASGKGELSPASRVSVEVV